VADSPVSLVVWYEDHLSRNGANLLKPLFEPIFRELKPISEDYDRASAVKIGGWLIIDWYYILQDIAPD
tara:strand:+ start:797 stop:1003 length:207 start_codon:yes stop_codon:yes gene_type:complete